MRAKRRPAEGSPLGVSADTRWGKSDKISGKSLCFFVGRAVRRGEPEGFVRAKRRSADSSQARRHGSRRASLAALPAAPAAPLSQKSRFAAIFGSPVLPLAGFRRPVGSQGFEKSADVGSREAIGRNGFIFSFDLVCFFTFVSIMIVLLRLYFNAHALKWRCLSVSNITQNRCTLNSVNIMDIIKRINGLRNERNWSINNLAMEAGITQSTLSSILCRNSLPKIDTLQCICNAFGLTLSQFFLEDEKVEILSESEKEMLQCFRKLSPKQQKALIEVFSG